MDPKKIERPKQLLVEGDNDLHFFRHLLHHLGIEDVQVRAYNGVNKLTPHLGMMRSLPDFDTVTSVGVTRDADLNAGAAFQSASDALHNSGFLAPTVNGAIENGNPNVGVFVLPDGNGSGMLETLCLASVAQDVAIPCIDQYLQCIAGVGINIPNLEKARCSAFLASRDPAGLLIGQAAERGIWPWHEPIFDPIKAFLNSL